MNDAAADLIECWRRSPAPSVKIASYFPVYADLFAHLRGTSCTFIETGVLGGGSLFMWQEWLGPQARVVGIDLNPDAARWRAEGFDVFIGDQGDPAFWRTVLPEIGCFDALLDDGGHQSFQQIVTAQEGIAFANAPCVIAVEDTSTSFMTGFMSDHGDHSFLSYAKAVSDCLVGRSFELAPERYPAASRAAVDAYRSVYCVQFFDGIVAFQIDAKRCVKPEKIENRPVGDVRDYRTSGRRSAEVQWPSLFQPDVVRVSGGRPQGFLSAKLSALAKRLDRA